MDANFSTMTMPKTMPVQNLLRYITFKDGKLCCYYILQLPLKICIHNHFFSKDFITFYLSGYNVALGVEH